MVSMEQKKTRRIEDEYFPDTPILYGQNAKLETILWFLDKGVVLEKREYEVLLTPVKRTILTFDENGQRRVKEFKVRKAELYPQKVLSIPRNFQDEKAAYEEYDKAVESYCEEQEELRKKLNKPSK
jgi:hypothetical protein